MIEKSLTNALSPERSIGLMLFDSFWNEHAVGQLGIFSTDGDDDQNGFGIWDEEEGDGGWAVTGRFGLIPWAKDKCRFLHLGVGGSYRSTDEVRCRARPGLAKGPFVVDTLPLADPDEVLMLSAEAVLVWNSFHVASEYVMTSVERAASGDPTFSAWYVQASWFLTGEAKAWSFPTAQWANTKPCCSFLSNDCCCWGGLELVARYDTLDLNDGLVTGGDLTNIAAGLNWYLNPNTRIMFNVIFSNVQDRASGGVVLADEDITSFLMRWDIHF
jgi:phosphate-selective porin OprO/OprP